MYKKNTPIFVKLSPDEKEENLKNLIEVSEKNNIDGIMLCREEFNNVPYGVVETDQDSNFLSITEKPQYKYLVNGGIYILSSRVINLIKKLQFKSFKGFETQG